MTLVAGMQIGKYVVRRKLAEGGMAEIYLCTARGAEGFEKEVVIKRVRAFLASDPEFVGMFIAEARLASRLNHENVVQIFDFDKHEDTYYLAMEYVRGCSLWELRRRSKEMMDPVPPMLVAHIGAEVARGLHYAHRLKVNGQPLDLVHRDVTPHNVLLSYDGAVKLTDFGIAKAGKKLTQPGVLKGKFAYMSPEQARGEAVDSRTDLFALGVVLWEMLTGGRLFDGDSELAVLRAVQHSAIAPPARLNPEVPPELDAVVMRALERDPSARFQTAGELERALAQCVLKHATSVDDTDLGAFLRRLFPGSLTQAMPTVQERTHVVQGTPVPDDDDDDVPAPRREPTAVMAAGRVGVAVPSSPDEDVDASTFVLPRRSEDVEALSVPLPPMATPMMPLPAVASSPVPRANAPLPPLAAPIATVRPSRPEGTPAVASSEEGGGGGPRSDVTPVPTKTPSRSGGLSPVASGSQGEGLHPDNTSAPTKAPSRSGEPASVAMNSSGTGDGLRAESTSVPTKTPSRSGGLAPVATQAPADASPRGAESERSSLRGDEEARGDVEPSGQNSESGQAVRPSRDADPMSPAKQGSIGASWEDSEEDGAWEEDLPVNPRERDSSDALTPASEMALPSNSGRADVVSASVAPELSTASHEQRDSKERGAGATSSGHASSAPSTRAPALDAREGGPQSLSGSEVPTVTDTSPGRPKPSVWLRPRRMLGLTMSLGLLLIVGAGVMNGLRGDPSTETATTGNGPLAAAPKDGTPIGATPPAPTDSAPPGGEPGGSVVKETNGPVPAVTPSQAEPGSVASGTTPSAASPEPVPSESDVEVEGLKREAVLGTGSKAVDPEVRSESTPRAAPNATGLLQLRATPYATVFLDGRRLGEVSGRASYKLAPGTYTLLFKHPLGEKRFDVTITAGATVTREFRAPRGR
ncbi:serine/threonine protein kinase [Myxococcus sp. CA056]|uniref:serine/threonine protein kinase n=1 Tax=Myxococcus sp. CA056 TaxID=2741740 RepID=UPI0020C6EB79|nr:serine/threonine protein kinase [Myxococcus sp. CA056]